jgi:hypothetical protein
MIEICLHNKSILFTVQVETLVQEIPAQGIDEETRE